ncbi:YdcH family protein [uncultured Roseobacter sp.]|uniref:YdcH family protein n=1 Tax=uncultured Roseobacter sp. TaxID=114847 RepID=UPI00345D1DC8
MSDDLKEEGVAGAMRAEELLRLKLRVTEQEHRDLVDAIDRMRNADVLTLGRLRKQKLFLKDQIAQLQDELEQYQPAEFDPNAMVGYIGGNKNNKNQDVEEKLDKDDGQLVQRSVRLSETLLEAVQNAARDAGLSQQEWMRRQFAAGAAKQSPPPVKGGSSPQSVKVEGLSTSGKVHKKQVGLRLEDSLFDAVVGAADEAGVPRNDWLRAAVVKAIEEGLDVRALLEPTPGEDTEKPEIS